MIGASQTCKPQTSRDTSGVTSSRGSGDGTGPCGLPGGLTAGQSGRGAVPASRSRAPGSAGARKTSGICGPNSSGSSASASLELSWVSRWLQRLASGGSMEYVLTLKGRVTPCGRVIPALRASGRSTSGSGCTGWPSPASGRVSNRTDTTLSGDGRERPNKLGWAASLVDWPNQTGETLVQDAMLGGWPTPVALPANGKPEDFLRRKRESIERGHSMGVCLSDLQMVAKLAGWPTLNVPNRGCETQERKDGRPDSGGIDLQSTAQLADSPTPTDVNGGRNGLRTEEGREGSLRGLEGMPKMLTGWATPATVNWRSPKSNQHGVNARPLQEQVGLTSSSSPAATGRSGGSVLNPAMSRWLMGFPQGGLTPGWDTCSAGWASWVLTQRLLAEYCERQGAIGSGD